MKNLAMGIARAGQMAEKQGESCAGMRKSRTAIREAGGILRWESQEHDRWREQKRAG